MGPKKWRKRLSNFPSRTSAPHSDTRLLQFQGWKRTQISSRRSRFRDFASAARFRGASAGADFPASAPIPRATARAGPEAPFGPRRPHAMHSTYHVTQKFPVAPHKIGRKHHPQITPRPPKIKLPCWTANNQRCAWPRTWRCRQLGAVALPAQQLYRRRPSSILLQLAVKTNSKTQNLLRFCGLT